MRLIDADATKSLVYISPPAWGRERDLMRVIDSVPTIDAEPVRHGRWGFLGMDMMAGSRAFYFGTCSECRERINFEPKHKNYCPNCGAKMDGDSND